MSLFGRTKDVDADLRRHDGLDGSTSTSMPVGIRSTSITVTALPMPARADLAEALAIVPADRTRPASVGLTE